MLDISPGICGHFSHHLNVNLTFQFLEFLEFMLRNINIEFMNTVFAFSFCNKMHIGSIVNNQCKQYYRWYDTCGSAPDLLPAS